MNPRSFEPRPRLTKTLTALAMTGAVLLALGAATSWERSTSSLLIAAFFLVTVSLGGLVFIALEYITGAGWSVAFRRVPEALAWSLGMAGLMMVGAVALRAEAYAWNPPASEAVGTFWFKQMWLTPAWLVGRAVCYVLLWTLLARAMIRASRRQDETHAIGLTVHHRRRSAMTLLLFAPTFTLAACDWLMSLEPLWFSTVWGGYHFAGMMMSTLAVVVLLCLYLRRSGPLRGTFHNDHLHDLGQLLIGFSCFWMYLWFSQYMLIWYSNIPEETFYFVSRMQGAWGPLTIANLALNWLLPFLVLLPRPNKRNGVTMARIAVVILMGRWLDLYLMVYPSTSGAVAFGLPEIGAVLLASGVLGMLFFRALSRASLVPVGDPHLAESLPRQTHEHEMVPHAVCRQ
jgi:hypothetical protein